MKTFRNTSILLVLLTAFTAVMAQPRQEEYLGLPGDNLNLYAVMKLFQESSTLEGFERNLNDENSRINNLDLNQDNMIDYIKVVDFTDRDVHNIVLQVAVNPFENQDVAVFEVQRFSNGQVRIQLTGDEDLYGKNYIIQPFFDEQLASETPNPGYTGDGYGNVSIVRTNYYEVAAWPVIRFIYTPGYVVWNSPWTWGFWPTYWHPWRPYYWDFYYGYHYNNYHNYYSHYHRYNSPHYAHWNDFYYHGNYSHSHYVSENIRSGHYNTTYSHPDERRKGEALYARTNPDRGGNTAGRRTTSTVTRTTPNTGTTHNTGTARRTATTVNDRQATNQMNEKVVSSVRKSNATMSKRLATEATTAHNTAQTRRSPSAVSDRPAPDPRPAQNTARSSSGRQGTNTESFSTRKSTDRGPTETMTPRRSSSVQNQTSAKGHTETMTARRSSGQNQTAKTQNSEKKRTTEVKKSDRR